MHEVGAPCRLLCVHATTELDVHSTIGLFACDNVRVALGVIDVLPTREWRAHWTAHQEHGLFLRQ